MSVPYPFVIDEVLAKVEKAIVPFRKAALFELYDDGFQSVFEQLVACIISIRTLDEVTIVASQRLFEITRTPHEMLRCSVEQIDAAIHACTFHEAKAKQIVNIAHRAVHEHGGKVPCDAEVLLSFRGVGPKCAHLVLGIACGMARIGVDIHVHRVTNRWGYVQTRAPEETGKALEKVLPKPYWIDINRLLVPFGKHICTGNHPRCSTCPVLEMCAQIAVTSHR